jgi:hypothetical protein
MFVMHLWRLCIITVFIRQEVVMRFITSYLGYYQDALVYGFICDSSEQVP